MAYEKMTPIEGRVVGCLNCGYKPGELPMDVQLYDGNLQKNGKTVWDFHQDWDGKVEDGIMTVQQAEDLAKKEPDEDWRIYLLSALSEANYQRQGDNSWVLYETGQGWA